MTRYALILLAALCFASLSNVHAQNRGRLNADRLILTGDTNSYRDSAYVSMGNGEIFYEPSVGNYWFKFRNRVYLLPDSLYKMMRENSSATDTSKLVSMNRDDAAIRGEKTFLGVIGSRRFGQFDLTLGQRRAFWASADTATKRLGDTVFTIAQLGAGNQILQVYSSGIVDLPKQSSVRAYRNGTQSLSAGVDTRISWNAESWDTQYEFDNATNYRFVARAAGTYLVTATAAATAAAPFDMYLTVYANGSQHSIGGIATSWYNGFQDYAAGNVQGMVALTAGQYIEVYVVTRLAATLQGNSVETHLEILKVM